VRGHRDSLRLQTLARIDCPPVKRLRKSRALPYTAAMSETEDASLTHCPRPL
jgi:hypothetical protein